MKSLILSGLAGSGKTTMAKAIASMYKPEEVSFASSIIPNGFSADSTKTKLIVFDEIKTEDDIISINKSFRKMFRNTKIIFCTQEQCVNLWDDKEFSVVRLNS
ncbi:MAG TPA: AAA family ATPase [Paludibacter sp.]|nr:AAA family ATPase [Paludibacter sp.]